MRRQLIKRSREKALAAAATSASRASRSSTASLFTTASSAAAALPRKAMVELMNAAP